MKTTSLKELLLPEASGGDYPYALGWNDCRTSMIERIEALEASAERVYGNVNEYGGAAAFDTHQMRNDTYTALLVCIEPIQKGVTKSELKDALVDFTNGMSRQDLDGIQRKLVERIMKLADRIEAYGLEGIRDD